MSCIFPHTNYIKRPYSTHLCVTTAKVSCVIEFQRYDMRIFWLKPLCIVPILYNPLETFPKMKLVNDPLQCILNVHF